jgi:hypothetical protein
MKNIKKNKSGFLFSEKAIFLLPAFIITLAALIFIYAEASIISPKRIFIPLMVLWGITFLLIWPLQKITQNWAWTGAGLSVFVIAFYLSETMFYIIAILYSLSFACLAFTFWILKRKPKAKQVAIISNFIALFFLIFIAVQFIPILKAVEWREYQNAITRNQNSVPVAKSLPSSKPDIYYIVLDAYARTDVLEQYYQFNNSEFIEHLTDKGFFVPTKSYSNYPRTALSVTSTLNFDYDQEIMAGLDTAKLWWLVNPFWQNSRMKIFLERLDYTSISIASNWELSNNPTADIYFKPTPLFLNEFDGFVLAKTPLKLFIPALNKIASVPSYKSHRELILYNFEVLEKVAEMPEPTFTVAHIIAPHPPFVFDQDGNPLSPNYAFSYIDETSIPLTNEEYRNGYTAQIEFINHKLETMIEAILAKSETPPIIILQADHGPRRVIDPSSFDNKCQQERFAIFAAYYLPGLPENPIPNDITSVNLFRIILNEYFSTALPMLENHSYSTENIDSPFIQKDVTDDLEKKCPPIIP